MFFGANWHNLGLIGFGTTSSFEFSLLSALDQMIELARESRPA